MSATDDDRPLVVPHDSPDPATLARLKALVDARTPGQPEPAARDYNHELRARALSLPEADLRRAVERLLEQCGRETAYPAPSSPRNGMLHVTEIYALMGLRGPDYSRLARALDEDAKGGES